MDINELLTKNSIEIKDIKYRIIKIKEKQDYVLIYLDNDEKLSISIENYFKYKLSQTKGLDENSYNQLHKEESVLLGYLNCLRKLSIKDYSTKQIREYLYQKKKLDNYNINEIIDKLTNYGLLDDEKYTVNRFNYLNNQLLSIKQIKYKLINEGIDNDLIEKYVIIDSEKEYEKVAKLVIKYSNSIKHKSLAATKKAILTKIVSNGYSYDNAYSAIDNLNLKKDDEIKLLSKEFDKAYTKYSKKYESYDLKNHIYAYLINKGFNNNDIKSIMEDKHV